LGEPLRTLRVLASGYPLHHPHSYFIAVAGGFAAIPLASWRKKNEKLDIYHNNIRKY